MKIFSTLILTASVGLGFSQTLVGTQPTTKTAILEEFTGVNCPNCPDGQIVAQGILASYPGDVILMGYHPVNSSYTTPQNGTDEDLRRGYLDAFYTTAYVGSRFMPGAMINRRAWGNPAEKNTSRSLWDSYVQTIMGENSPVNVGLSSSYDGTANTLTVDVEVYYTAAVTNSNAIYVHITEDDIVTEQSGSGGGPAYVHSHTFRDELNAGQWGDAIPTTTMGTLFTTQYVFDLTTATAPIDLSKAHVVAFVYDGTTEEIYSGAEVDAMGGTTSSVQDNEVIENTTLYPNPTNGEVNIEIEATNNASASINIVDVLGKTVNQKNITLSKGLNKVKLNSSAELVSGIYFVNIQQGKTTKSLKLIVR